MVRRAPLVLIAMAMATTARAQDLPPCADQERASEAYQAGATALREARYSDAARKFGEADERCPHEVALDEAMRAVVRADNPILCMQLVERAERRDVLAERRAELSVACSSKVGRIVVVCPGATCRASVDGEPVRLHEEFPVLVGRRVVDLSVDGGPVVPHSVEVKSGQVARVPAVRGTPAPTVPAPGPSPDGVAPDGNEEPEGGLHPAVFFVGLGLTAAASGVLIWSGVDALGRNDDFKTNPDASIRDDGMKAQDRTNALIGVTAAFAVGTAITALFTDWGGGDGAAAATMTIDPRGRGAFATWRASF